MDEIVILVDREIHIDSDMGEKTSFVEDKKTNKSFNFLCVCLTFHLLLS